MHRKYVVGNWKMNGTIEESLLRATEIARFIEGRKNYDTLLPHIIVCPPYHLLASIAFVSTNTCGGLLGVGAQDCHSADKGAYTGDVSAPMIKDCRGAYTLVGHSERRLYHHETNAMVHDKILAAHRAGLTAIVCIGETKDVYDSGHALAHLTTQLQESLPLSATPANTVVAYEPVWSIGTGLIPSIKEIDTVHQHIQEVLGTHLSMSPSFAVLYGGSVNAANAKEILALPSVSGVLVGGASLVYTDFISIIKSC